jgi:hypothetical protein
MYKYLIGLIILVAVFFSGAVPYSLIYDIKDADKLGMEKPLTDSDIQCEIDKTEGYQPGQTISGEFSINLTNHSNRFMLAHVEGEILPPKGYGGIHYKKVFLSPGETQYVNFRSTTKYVGDGRYQCEVRYNIGWGQAQ